MKKLRHFVSIATIASLALVGCSQVDDFTANSDLTNNESNAVSFGTYMGNAKETRAYTSGPITNDATGDNSLKTAQFGVFAYHTSDATDANANYNPTSVGSAPSNIAPNFMYNQQITWNASSPAAWVYSPVKYWPNGLDAASTHEGTGASTQKEYQKLSFFAFAPYTATPSGTYSGTVPTGVNESDVFENANTNGIKALTKNTFTGNVWVKYLLPNAQEDKAVDLLWGLRGSASYSETDDTPSAGTIGTDYNINLTKQTKTEKVKFLFKHALAKIQGSSVTDPGSLDEASSKCGFSVKLDVDGNDGDNQTTFFGAGNGFNKAKTLVTIKSVKIQDGKTASDDSENGLESKTSDIYTSGWFNIETGNWDMAGATTGAKIDINVQNNTTLDNATNNVYTLNPKIREVSVTNATGTDWNPAETNSSINGYTGGAEGVEVTAKPLFANEYVPGLMFIPGQNQTIYVTVDYIVRTADANLSTGYSQVEQVITNKVTLPAASLGANKIFKIIMHLGLTSVKFEAVVADWQTNAGGSYDTDGHYSDGGSSANEDHVWLPSNVVE